jgi:hypothetical protein
MKVGFIYLNIIGKSDPTAPEPSQYDSMGVRFAETYRKFKGDVPHRLQVVHCGGIPGASDMARFDGLDALHTFYAGGGWDIGAHQYAALSMAFDFVICANTPIYFWRHGFIEAMVEARNLFGNGLYGPTASYENKPHIRTCCWAFDPKTFANYPHRIDTREKTYRAESGDLSITEWYETNGMNRVMVAPSGFYCQSRWREPENIFRRGTQENCYVFDRHTDNFPKETPEMQRILVNMADGRPPYEGIR